MAKKTAYNDLDTFKEAVLHCKALKSRLVLNITGFYKVPYPTGGNILMHGLEFAYDNDVEVQFISQTNYMLVKPKEASHE